jgi:hypothetical protein
MINAHDDDTLFSCLQCNAQFTKDIFLMHTKEMDIARLCHYRQCPFPICGFRVRWKPLVTGCLDSLKQHLLEKHNIKQRDLIAGQLKRIGYNATTCNIICPICPPPCQFVTHEDFYQHFMQNHFHGPACGVHGDGPCSMGAAGELDTTTCDEQEDLRRLPQCTWIPDEVRLYRRQILSLWPSFSEYPVWDDIQCRSDQA